MENLNYVFFEAFKHLNRLCEDIYEKPGVTNYIDEMKSKAGNDYYCVPDWNKDLEHLVQMRKIRNDLAHTEGAFLEEFCTQYDIDWIRAFRERILNGSDPLTLLRKSNVRTQMSGQINNRLRQGGQLQPKNQESKQYTYSQYSRDNQSNGKDNTPLWLGILIAGFAILAVVIVVIIIIVIVHIDSVVGE